MSFYVVFVWYTHWYACWKCKREWLLCWLMEFSTTILFWISNYLPASKAQWLKLKSCIWSAISMCVSLLKIMPGNKGCAACQRGNTGNNLTSKRAAPAVCSRLGELGWRITAAQTKQRESCRPLALLIYQISNLTCSFTESPPKKTKKNKKNPRCRVQGPVARYFWFIWSSCRNTRYDPKNGIAWQELCWTAFPFPS